MKMPKYGQNMACMNNHCVLFRREGEFFCTPCYNLLPVTVTRLLWKQSLSEISEGIRAGKAFLHMKFEREKAEKEKQS